MTAVESPRNGLHDWTQAIFAPRTAAPGTATMLRSVLWPLAIMAVIHRTIVLPANGNITDDFKPVYRALSNFRRGWDIYNEHFDYVDPHYLYPPGGTLIMAPFGYLPFAESRYLFVAVNSAAIVLAGVRAAADVQLQADLGGGPSACCWRCSAPNPSRAHWFSPTSTASSCCARCCSCAGCWTVRKLKRQAPVVGRRRDRSGFGGEAGAATTAVLPFLNRQWRAVLAALVVPAAFNLAAWPLVVHPMDFVTRTVPYTLGVRDYFNSSIEGNGVYFGLPFWLILFLRILFTLLAIGGLWLLYRYYRTRDPLFWFTTSSGVLLLWSWLVLALAQGYYSMMLFPFLMTVVLPNSVIRNWPAWLGVYGFLTMDKWLLLHWMYIGRPLDYLKITYGWSLLLIVVFTVLYFRYVDAKAENRLDDGIDPPWVTPPQPRASVEA